MERPGENHTPSCFVIGDIHGCCKELDLLLSKLPLEPHSTIVFIGDYIDRGPEAKQVVDRILDLGKHYRVVPLMGNHESMLLDFLEHPHSVEAGMFICGGGSCTLASYADEYGDYSLPDEHVTFYRQLPLFHQTADYYFVHAGVPEIPLERIGLEHWEDLLWSREVDYSSYSWSKRIVHGHSPRRKVEILPGSINVDTACVYGGQLTALELPSMTVHSVPLQRLEPPRYLRDIRSNRKAMRFQGSIPVSVTVGTQSLHFLTINYSEIGMLLRGLSSPSGLRLESSQLVRGTIGARGPWRVEFTGEVVRREEKPEGVFYAIHILGSTYDEVPSLLDLK